MPPRLLYRVVHFLRSVLFRIHEHAVRLSLLLLQLLLLLPLSLQLMLLYGSCGFAPHTFMLAWIFLCTARVARKRMVCHGVSRSSIVTLVAGLQANFAECAPMLEASHVYTAGDVCM